MANISVTPGRNDAKADITGLEAGTPYQVHLLAGDGSPLGVGVGFTTTPAPVQPVIGTTAYANGKSYPVSGVNVYRDANQLVGYTRTAQQTVTPTNRWGIEVVIIDGKVTSVNNRWQTGSTSGTAIPENGYVLSGHDAAGQWLLDNAKVGAAITYESAPAPAPTPTPTPSPSGSGLPSGRFAGGYLTTWEGRATLRQVVDTGLFGLIYGAFAIGSPGNGGFLRMDMMPGCTTAADTKSQIAYANSKGVKVIVSVGGYFDYGYSSNPPWGYNLGTQQAQDEFMMSMRVYRNTYGFNGMDWDLEHGNRSDIAGIIAVTKRMRTEFGNDFIIACAPGPNLATWFQWGREIDTWAAAQGVNSFDLFGEQCYDLGMSEASYSSTIVSRMRAVAAAFGENRTALGNKYKNDSGASLEDPSNNFVDISTTRAALRALEAEGIDVRSVYHWTIQSDSDRGYEWGQGMKAELT